jgi:hypothetical protein
MILTGAGTVGRGKEREERERETAGEQAHTLA